MFKNVSSQKIVFLAYDSTNGTPKTGDAANITAYVSKDAGAVTILADTSATELDATNAKGVYVFDLAQGETNGDMLLLSAKSSTSNIYLDPVLVFTTPANFSSMSVDSNGRVDVIKIAGTTQTAGDIFARVGAPAGASVSADIAAIKAVDDAIKLKTDNLPVSPASTTNITAGTITTVTNLTNAPTAGDFTATMKASITTAATAATPTAAAVTGNVGGNVVGSVGSVSGLTASDVGAIKAKTDNLPSDPADESIIIAATDAVMSRLGAPAGASVSADIAAVNSKTTNLPASPAAVGSAMTLTAAYDAAKTAAQAGDSMALTSAYDFAKGTVAMTESYASQGATMTPVQALYQTVQHLGESGIALTTKTVKKRDGSTTAKTFTLDDAATPTSITETT